MLFAKKFIPKITAALLMKVARSDYIRTFVVWILLFAAFVFVFIEFTYKG